jgi:hypothetical protein
VSSQLLRNRAARRCGWHTSQLRAAPQLATTILHSNGSDSGYGLLDGMAPKEKHKLQDIALINTYLRLWSSIIAYCCALKAASQRSFNVLTLLVALVAVQLCRWQYLHCCRPGTAIVCLLRDTAGSQLTLINFLQVFKPSGRGCGHRMNNVRRDLSLTLACSGAKS